MITVNEVMNWMAQQAPCEMAESWDNVGLLVESGRPVEKILVCLDITPAVVREAAEQNCQLIVSHHPVIFTPLRRLDTANPAFQLAQQGISAICMHTNLDAAQGGVNDVLAQRMELEQVQPFGEGGLGRMGYLYQPCTARQLADRCAQALNAHIKYADGGKGIQRLAVVGGSGGDFWRQAQAAGAQALLTGEASHHDALDAQAAGFTLLVGGHFCTEQPMVEELARRLAEQFRSVQVQLSSQSKDPYQYL